MSSPTTTDPVRVAQARRARAVKALRRDPSNPDLATEAAEALSEMRAATIERAIRRVVADWGPLSPEQRDRLAVLLTGRSR